MGHIKPRTGEKKRPGQVRDAIVAVLENRPNGASLKEIETEVSNMLGSVSPSSIRSYLRLNTEKMFVREERGVYLLNAYENILRRAEIENDFRTFEAGRFTLVNADCLEWMQRRESNSLHAVVTDPPYGLFEYSDEQQLKLRNGKGGVWRIPPSFDGNKRSPLPRFTVLDKQDLQTLEDFFFLWARRLMPILVPGANVIVASNPLLSYLVAGAITKAGFQRRGEIIRLVMTMRGGDRPKAAHKEFSYVSVMPRSMWEPWLIFRKPLEGRVQDNLRKWKTGGFRRPSADRPFGDVIHSSPTNRNERRIAAHPSLKPQAFLRQIVRASLPMGEGVVFDPFAGSGSTLAAAENLGYESIGIEKDQAYFDMATQSIARLSLLHIT